MTMQEVLKNNKKAMRIKLIEKKRQERKELLKETILAIVIGSFIMITTLILMNKTNTQFMNDCMSAGHSQTYCERGA